MQEIGKLQARQCMFLSFFFLLHFLHICNAFISNHFSFQLCHYAKQIKERRPINVLAMPPVWSQKMQKSHESSVLRHDNDRWSLTSWIVALESPAECNGEPLRGMNKKTTELSKRTRSTNIWILLQLSSIAAVFDFFFNEKVKDLG